MCSGFGFSGVILVYGRPWIGFELFDPFLLASFLMILLTIIRITLLFAILWMFFTLMHPHVCCCGAN